MTQGDNAEKRDAGSSMHRTDDIDGIPQLGFGLKANGHPSTVGLPIFASLFRFLRCVFDCMRNWAYFFLLFLSNGIPVF